jgi:serine protease DegQ
MIKLKDGREFEATKLGGDKESDIAVLKIDPINLEEIKIANSENARDGEYVVEKAKP